MLSWPQFAQIIRGSVIAGLIGIIASPGAIAQANRIVSLNLCTDQLVMLLADRANIASISALAEDPAISAYPEMAAGLHLNYGLAEEVLALEPDIVVTSSFGLGATTFLLRALGHEVIEVGFAGSLGDIRRNIETVADAVGLPTVGAMMAAQFSRGLALATVDAGEQRPFAALYWANGFTSGAGTLPNGVLEAAGFRTVATELGINGVQELPLELLITAEPDILVVSEIRQTSALANEVFSHPALERAFASKPTAFIPNSLWNCGTPAVLDAFAQLAQVRNRWVEDQSGVK